ncbi:MAG: MmgE/PrpD family protein [Rhodospirillaceae bacterium]
MPDSHDTAQQAATATPTHDLARWISGAKPADFTPRARRWARHAILDWFGVTIAGADDPLVGILADDALAAGEAGAAPLVGRTEKVTPTMAAMINGAASHALDYDDVNKRLHGHPTVPVVPAIMALAQQTGSSGRDVVDAFIVGYEAECLVGEMMGLAHYDHGWHATATVGTFGAAAGCARMLGLDADKTAMALGIAATQAAGLKSMFGTMCKPLHAGKAAMNGLLAARLAARGFTSRPDAIECEQGFGKTQSADFHTLPVRPDPAAPYAVEENLFKYHAACYLTHSSIEAIRKMTQHHGFGAADVTRVRTRVDAGHRKVCDIPEPETGLQVKFSIRHCIAMALSGIDTSDRDIYTEATANRPDLMDLRRKVEVEDTKHKSRHAAEVVIDLTDGRSVVEFFDVGAPADDVDLQEQRLAAKFTRLAEPTIGAGKTKTAADQVMKLDDAEDVNELLKSVALA